ncbi:MAG: Fpg/Nei family DNA glycosylase [Bacteroidota bacterium]
MPELPEVEVFKSIVDDTSLNKTIRSIYIEREDILEDVSPQEFNKALEGDSFVSTSRHGKYLFIETEQGHTVLMHFGMTAHPVFYESADTEPDYPRLIFHFDDDGHLAFDCRRMLGKLSLVDSKDALIEEKKLGIDAMDPALDKTAFVELIRSSRGYIKTSLMKQELMAGIGNEMADEMVYQAGLHPKSKVGKLSDQDIEHLYDQMHQVCEVRIQTKTDPALLPDDYLLKHRSDGETCPKCGGEIKQVKISGRSSYVCDHCQELKA